VTKAGALSSGGVASGVGLAAGLGAAPPDVLSLYFRLLPAEFFAQVREQEKLRRPNNRIYTDAVVIWLMILQRLSGGTLETAVMELLRTLPPEFWPQPCKRLQGRAEDQKTRLSGNTGSYNQARAGITLNDRGTVWGSNVSEADRADWQTRGGQPARCVFCGRLIATHAR
jgi:hypothetical protein